jgi:hypothetical protein
MYPTFSVISLLRSFAFSIYCRIIRCIIFQFVLSRVIVTISYTMFRLVNRFIDHLQVVTTNNHNTIADFHNTNHSALNFFFNWYTGGLESNWVFSVLRSLIGLLWQPRVIMMMEKLVEWLAKEAEVFGENLPQCRFVHYKPHILSRSELGPPRLEASD